MSIHLPTKEEINADIERKKQIDLENKAFQLLLAQVQNYGNKNFSEYDMFGFFDTARTFNKVAERFRTTND